MMHSSNHRPPEKNALRSGPRPTSARGPRATAQDEPLASHTPDSPATTAESASLRPLSPQNGAGLVLIVDDVPDNLAVLHDALDAAGYTVLVATDGTSALQRAAQADPDIVLLDAVMPGIDGFEVARRL